MHKVVGAAIFILLGKAIVAVAIERNKLTVSIKAFFVILIYFRKEDPLWYSFKRPWQLTRVLLYKEG
jgi:hypothetical protein